MAHKIPDERERNKPIRTRIRRKIVSSGGGVVNRMNGHSRRDGGQFEDVSAIRVDRFEFARTNATEKPVVVSLPFPSGKR